VLVTDAFGGHGGIALYMRDVLHCVASMEPRPAVTLIARVGTEDGSARPDNIHWDTSALRGKFAFARSVLQATNKSERPDLVLCGHINLLPLARLAAYRSGAFLVLFIHGIEAWKPPRRLLARRLARSADRIISVSDITRQRFLSWSKSNPRKVVLGPNAVKLERFGIGPKNPELLARYGIEGKCVLMTLARLSAVQRHKGVDEIIAVLPRLLHDFPDLVYLVAGGGDDIPRLQGKAMEHGVSDRVVFTGLVDEAEKADHYRLADAFALTGRGDGFGFVLLEAMACGVPVVASILDGSQEAVRNGKLGGLANPDDPDSLVDGIARALGQPKAIPEGLEYFAHENFCRRLGTNLAGLSCCQDLTRTVTCE
jgi:glycosyltransferase involved in cell wall biosynthesis